MANLREIWDALRRSESSETAGDFRMRLCHMAVGIRIFAAVKGARHQAALVIEVGKELLPEGVNAFNGRRLSVIAAELPGLPPDRGAVVIQLCDDQFEDLFEQLGVCLIDEISGKNNAADGVQAALQQIDRWRRFLERHQGALSQEGVRGLIGELSILERLVHRIGANQALAAWQAPRGSIRDFECADVAIEVKTLMTSAGGSVRINDPLQLEPEPGVPLLLACQELARSTQQDSTLPGHVSRVARLFDEDLRLQQEFGDALASMGYLASHANLYTDSFSLGRTHTFEVCEGFPRLRAADIPAFVSCVQFSLDVLPMSRFAVSSDVAIGPTAR